MQAVPYHAKMGLGERTENLERFRKFVAGKAENEEDALPILVCTDLASRGLDIPGVTAIIQLQFSGNVVAHLHRMGRSGRAGIRNGRGVIFYGASEELLVNVVQDAEEEQSQMQLAGDVEDLEEDGSEGKKIPSSKDAGKVKDAFSRKRGFTKKVKKARRVRNDYEQQY
jgi:superfamily II DNA/RNA helicase